MTRSELVDRLHSRVPTLTHDDAKSVVDVILEAITRSVVDDSRVEIRGFGSFSQSCRHLRKRAFATALDGATHVIDTRRKRLLLEIKRASGHRSFVLSSEFARGNL